MIKQIQLRGISRTPSDRMTSDGGCAESLNVHMADNELSPTLPPEDVTETLGLPANAGKDYIYIHKGNGYTNYITLDGLELGAYVDGTHEAFAYMEYEETLQSVSSIGNTLVIMGSKHPYYALFKDGHYVFLGSRIPLPTIRLTPEPVDEQITQDLLILESYDPNHLIPANVSWTMATWNEKAQEAEANGKRFAGIEDIPDAEPGEEEEPDIMTMMKAFATTAYATAKTKNVLINQVMAMYGVQLYNGSYITSVPVLMPGGFESPFYCRYLRSAVLDANTNFRTNTEYLQFGARYPYRIKAQMLDFDEETLKLWSDIIMSIDFFMTPTIPFDLSKEKVAYVERELKGSVSNNGTYFNYFDIRPCSGKYAREYIKRVLVNGSDMFHKVESLGTDSSSFETSERLVKMREEGVTLDINDYIVDQDLLQTQPALADYSYDMRNAERVAENITAMNNRLLMSGIEETIPSGSPVFPAAPCYLERGEEMTLSPNIEESHRTGISPLGTIDNNMRSKMFGAMVGLNPSPLGRAYSDFDFPAGDKYVQIVYHIQGRERYVVRGRIGAEESFVGRVEDNLGYFGFLLFPDPRCKSVDIYLSYNNHVWYKKSYEMREHPKLNCSYMYIGVDRNILWEVADTEMTYDSYAVPAYVDFSSGLVPADPSSIVESRVESKDDVLMLSDVDNPWFVPLGNEYQFQATEIIGTALATKALSTGQFGQFPLYVFTDNGIWAMQMNQLGTFSSSHAVSMDVAKKGTILALDQAVAFVTDKGLMLLTGSDIQNISPNMNGEHYTLASEYKGEIKGF